MISYDGSFSNPTSPRLLLPLNLSVGTASHMASNDLTAASGRVANQTCVLSRVRSSLSLLSTALTALAPLEEAVTTCVLLSTVGALTLRAVAALTPALARSSDELQKTKTNKKNVNLNF